MTGVAATGTRTSPGRRCGGIAVSHLIHSFDQVTSLLKFDRKEERARGVVALAGNTDGVRTAPGDLRGPKIETALVREATKEVDILLVDEEVGVVDCNRRVRAGSQSQRLYFGVSVVKIGREIRNLGH